MMKPTASYKMTKSGKIYLANTWHKPGRNARRRSVIQAELYSMLVVRNKKDRE